MQNSQGLLPSQFCISALGADTTSTIQHHTDRRDDAGESEQNQNQQDRDDGDSDEYVPDDKSDTSSPHGEEYPDTLTVASGDDEQEVTHFIDQLRAGIITLVLSQD
ncbi:hypothetical protein SNK03_010247 [Fusarium graminearum]